MRASAFQLYLDDIEREHQGESRLSALNPSLLQDLLRFEEGGRQTEVLEVLAACVRHGRSLVVHLQSDERVLPLTVFPLERLAHCPLTFSELLQLRLSELQVLHVEPAVLRPPGDEEATLVGEPHLYQPLAPLTWELAMRGSREELLPEIVGPAAYRLVPGTPLDDLPINGAVMAAVRRLERETSNLRDISDWPGFDRGRAMRMLNALYLQAALIVSRSHPAANNDSWFANL